MNVQATEKKYAETYLGAFGSFLPLVVMILAIIAMTVLGLRSTQNYWCAGFLAILASFLIFKDKSRFSAAFVNGIRSKTFATMTSVMLIAGVFSKVLAAGKLAAALYTAMTMLNVPGVILPVITFITSLAMSTASGSSAVSVATLTPVLLPMAALMGQNPALMVGAILSGAVFGDNLAPVSDTTLVSTLSVGADLGKAVRSRVKYSLSAAIPAAALFLFMGFRMHNEVTEVVSADPAQLKGLVFLVLPVLMVVLLLRKSNIQCTLLLGALLGIVMLVVFGYATPASILASDGVIVTGISGMLNIIILLLLVIVVMALVDEAGALDRLTKAIGGVAKTPLGAEIVCGIFICLTTVITASGLSTMTFCGPVVRKITAPFKIAPERMSNFLDGFGCSIANLLPYSGGTLITVATAVASGAVPESFGPMDFQYLNFFPILLCLVYWIAIFTGWGRTFEQDKPETAEE